MGANLEYYPWIKKSVNLSSRNNEVTIGQVKTKKYYYVSFANEIKFVNHKEHDSNKSYMIKVNELVILQLNLALRDLVINHKDVKHISIFTNALPRFDESHFCEYIDAAFFQIYFKDKIIMVGSKTREIDSLNPIVQLNRLKEKRLTSA